MIPTAIVVHDPLGDFPDGTVLRGPAQVARARHSGAMVLPYDEDLQGEHHGGYFRRGWGAGYELPPNVGRVCPMLVGVVPERPWLYWAAWVASAGVRPSGSIRLVGNTSGQGIQASPVGHNDAASIEGVPESGMIVGGRCRVTVAAPGFMSLNLWALATDARVMVSAVSQSRIDVPYP